MGGDTIDDLWAQLQAEDNAARSKKKGSGSKGKKKSLQVAAAKAPEKATVAASVSSAATEDKEASPEQLHYHIRSVMNGDLGQRKASLRAIAEYVLPIAQVDKLRDS